MQFNFERISLVENFRIHNQFLFVFVNTSVIQPLVFMLTNKYLYQDKMLKLQYFFCDVISVRSVVCSLLLIRTQNNWSSKKNK